MAKYPLRVALGERGSGYMDPLIPDLYISNNKNIVKDVPENAPLDNVIKAVNSGVLRVVSGSLYNDPKPTDRDVKQEQPKEVEVEDIKVDEEATEEEDSNKCIKITSKGRRCKNDALEGEQYCGIHIKNHK